MDWDPCKISPEEGVRLSKLGGGCEVNSNNSNHIQGVECHFSRVFWSRTEGWKHYGLIEVKRRHHFRQKNNTLGCRMILSMWTTGNGSLQGKTANSDILLREVKIYPECAQKEELVEPKALGSDALELPDHLGEIRWAMPCAKAFASEWDANSHWNSQGLYLPIDYIGGQMQILPWLKKSQDMLQEVLARITCLTLHTRQKKGSQVQ